jgi:hypothetical protein
MKFTFYVISQYVLSWVKFWNPGYFDMDFIYSSSLFILEGSKIELHSPEI